MVGLNETFYFNSCLCEGTRTSLENRTQALRALKTNIEKKLTALQSCSVITARESSGLPERLVQRSREKIVTLYLQRCLS